MLRSACIKTHPSGLDEVRISVMSRHTLRDGVTPDPEIDLESFDLHWPELGPAPKVIGGYYRGEIKWPEFKDLYLQRLYESQSVDKLGELANLARACNVMVLCIEAESDFCHRGVLLEHFSLHNPEIEVEVN